MPIRELPTTPGPDRSIPPQLIDLAVTAIRGGASRVSLLHEGMGADFHAPIGWLLRVSKAEDPFDPETGNTLFVDHQLGCELDDLSVPAWLTTDHPVIEELVDLFAVGATNGWDVTYERRELDYAVHQEVAKEYGHLSTLGLRHALEARATNWFYDQDAHDRGDQVSTTATLSLCEGERADLVAFSDDGGKHRRVDQEHIESLIRKQAPNFAPVAYYDGDRDGWVK